MGGGRGVVAQGLEAELLGMERGRLVERAGRMGDARRGAVVFYQHELACTRCHVAGEAGNRLGPDLAALGAEVTDEHLVESILEPSKVVRAGYEAVMLELEGDRVVGLVVAEDEEGIVLRDSGRDYKERRFAREEVLEVVRSPLSVMPSGTVELLANEQQFLDLVRYLMEIRDGGPARAEELEPAPALYARRALPGYESEIDHAGMIRGLDRGALERRRWRLWTLIPEILGGKGQPDPRRALKERQTKFRGPRDVPYPSSRR